MVTTSQAQYGPAYDILIVDNKELTRDTVQKILQQEGYTVDTARHGKEGIEKVRTNNYAYRLVITELIMPYAGGFEVIKTIKKESRIPVMVLSAVADEDTINESFRLSADDFLKKPFMASELVQRIQRLLIRHAAPVYPKTVVMPVPAAPSVPEIITTTEEDKTVEAVVAKRKRSIKAAASASQPKTVVIKKAPVSKKATAAKVTVSKTPVKKKAEKVTTATPKAKAAAVKTKTTTTKTKTTTAKTASAKGTAVAKKPVVAVKKTAEKKSDSGKTKKVSVKKAAGAATRTGKVTARGKSKLIIRNSIPMIRKMPQVMESRLQLKAGNIGSGLCAIAV